MLQESNCSLSALSSKRSKIPCISDDNNEEKHSTEI